MPCSGPPEAVPAAHPNDGVNPIFSVVADLIPEGRAASDVAGAYLRDAAGVPARPVSARRRARNPRGA